MPKNPKVGKAVRKVAKLDEAWRKGGKGENRAANDLAHQLGKAARLGALPAARRAQERNAQKRGQTTGW